MNTRSDKMASWPIGKLLFSMGLPAVFSMLIQALYNVVDTIYISRYSQDALFAIGVVTPMVMVGLSIALGGSVGVATLLARRLGERNREEADAVVSTGICLTFIHIIVTMLICFFFGKSFIRLFTDRADIVVLGFSYMSICMYVCFGQHISLFFERIMQAQSNMLVPMMAQLIGAVTNIILDPILIFGKGPFPAMGIAGAAIATVMGQIFSMCFCIFFFRKDEVKIRLRGLKMDKVRIRDIYAVGLPTMIMNAVGSFTTILMNSILVRFSENYVSSLSLYFKVQSFVFMPVFGFSQGALPILSYNYGARNRERYVRTEMLYMLTSVVILALGTLLFRFRTDLILSAFTMDDTLHKIASQALRTISLSFVFAAVSICMGSVFQSFGKGSFSMLQSILRQIVLLIPIAYWLSGMGEPKLVWYAYPISEAIVTFIFIPLTIRIFHQHFPLTAKDV
ncbi:MAG: MATE family efflux transporter [Erysipelotrichaceae bacterium]|nr:MATE family efflux transporter [Erysipelotrichaceae bacterium]